MKSSKNAKFFLEDFTFDNYRRLVSMAQEKYSFIGYADYKKEGKNALWRHDVDYSLDGALKIAKIEAEQGVQSTYFIYSHSEGYNLFEIESARIVNRIIALGHYIGLHADYGYYREILNDMSDCEDKIREEIDKLERDFQTKISAVSFHQPESREVKQGKNEYCAGVVNAYSEYILEEYGYCSDSNGYWRFNRLEDCLNDSGIIKLQVLLHPIWWSEIAMSPAQKVYAYYENRAKKQWRLYCEDMKRGNRINVGENDI